MKKLSAWLAGGALALILVFGFGQLDTETAENLNYHPVNDAIYPPA
ncbi:hypothetical protein Q7A53_17990 [Halobacillus rhizosphaerae]